MSDRPSPKQGKLVRTLSSCLKCLDPRRKNSDKLARKHVLALHGLDCLFVPKASTGSKKS